jgi:hypothetical protein
MSQRTLEHGQIKGLRCPHCPLVCQPLPGKTADELGVPAGPLGGLEAHMRAIHPEYYEAWVSAFRGPAADELDELGDDDGTR